MKLENKIEAILFFKNEPVTVSELAKIFEVDSAEVRRAIESLKEFYSGRGIVVVTGGDEASLGTNPEASDLIERIQKEELSRDLGRAGLETLAIILYRGPISRREIDYIRGVNSGFIIRNLMIRGLIERAESAVGERSFSYMPTLKLLQYLGVMDRRGLPKYEEALQELAKFAEVESTEDQNE